MHSFAVDDAGARAQAPQRFDDEREAVGEIIAWTTIEPHLCALLARNDAEVVVLDFMQPLDAGWQLVGFGRKAWRDEPGGEGTLQHVAQIELGRGDCNYSAQGMRLRIDARRSHSELAILRFARLR